MIDYILEQMQRLGVEWSFKAGKRTPERHELYEPLQALYKMLEDGKQAEFGRLLLKKEDEHTEVYIYLGDLHDRDFE